MTPQDIATLQRAVAGILAIPNHVLACDPVVRERHRRAKALCLALDRKPLDVAECNRLADALLQICGAPEAPAGKQ